MATTRSLRGRQELRILVPTALLTLVIVSVATLFAYRSSVEMVRLEHEHRAVALAQALARDLAGGGAVDQGTLRRHLPRDARATVVDPEGREVVSTTPFGAGEALPRGEAAFSRGEDEWTVVVSISSPVLAQSRGRLRVLVPLVLAVDLGVVILVLVYLRRVLSPLGEMLASAERSGRFDPRVDDEMDFLIETFDSAMQELAAPASDDLESVRRLLVADLDSGVLLCARDGDVVAINDAGAALLGLAEKVDRPAVPLEVLLAHQPELVARLRRAIDERRSLSREEIELAPSAASPAAAATTLGMTVHVLRRDDSEVRGFLVLFVDLSAARERAVEERLGETFEHIGEVAAGIAHELRNGVATLRGYLTLIERADGESIIDYTAELRAESDHLQRVVDDFLTLSRPGMARVEPLAIDELVASAAADPALGETISWSWCRSSGDHTVTVIGDRGLLVRALRNLLRNAIEASRTDERPVIEIDTIEPSERSEGSPHVEISVLDRGSGVPARVRERLFHPFVSGRRDGVGLGLALCLRIAKLHRGSLRIGDREEGRGTRATLTLPCGASVTSGNKPADSIA